MSLLQKILHPFSNPPNQELEARVDEELQNGADLKGGEVHDEVAQRRKERQMAELEFKRDARDNLEEVAEDLRESGFALEAVKLNRRLKYLEQQMELIRRENVGGR